MAYENPKSSMTFEADEDLTNDQYRIVVLDATTIKVRRPNAATDIPLGILQNAPDDGESATVELLGSGGVSKVVLGATLAINANIALEYVGASDAGKAQACVSTQYSCGQLILGGNEDDVGSVLMTPLTVTA